MVPQIRRPKKVNTDMVTEKKDTTLFSSLYGIMFYTGHFIEQF